MTIQDENAFRRAFNFKTLGKCCGTCRWIEREYEDCGCGHPMQAAFDSLEKNRAADDPDRAARRYNSWYGARVDEGCLCDLWEKSDDDERMRVLRLPCEEGGAR